MTSPQTRTGRPSWALSAVLAAVIGPIALAGVAAGGDECRHSNAVHQLPVRIADHPRPGAGQSGEHRCAGQPIVT